MNTKKILTTIWLVILLSVPAMAKAPLSHIKGVHDIGVRAGTGLGQTFDIGVLYQYHFSRRWSFVTNVDFEKGKFQNAGYWGVRAAPGAACSVWHPTSWFYLHLLGDINLGYDSWNNPDTKSKSNGFTMGLDLGINFEFYALSELSFVLQAQQGWNWGFYSSGYNYFHPLFSLGVKYNIK